jgi:hypothetical protein
VLSGFLIYLTRKVVVIRVVLSLSFINLYYKYSYKITALNSKFLRMYFRVLFCLLSGNSQSGARRSGAIITSVFPCPAEPGRLLGVSVLAHREEHPPPVHFGEVQAAGRRSAAYS